MAARTIITQQDQGKPREQVAFARVQHGDLCKIQGYWVYKVPSCFVKQNGSNAVNVHDGYPCYVRDDEVVESITGMVTINIDSHLCLVGEGKLGRKGWNAAATFTKN